MKTKGLIYAVVLVIALSIILVQGAVNQISGCTKSLLSKFESLELVSTYKENYIQQLQKDGYRVENSVWEIKKQGDGCVVEFAAYAYQLSTTRRVWYHGDKFLINLKDKKIYPQSEGAELFINAFGEQRIEP